jgi:hypothetical protein
MNEIFSARNAFDACLIISALLVEVSSSAGGRLRRADSRNPIRLVVVLASGQRSIDPGQQLGRPLAVRSHHDPVRMQKVLYRRALAQKLRIGDHVEVLPPHPIALNHAANPLIGVDRHRALFNDDLVARNMARNLAGHGLYVGQVGIAGLGLRRAHRDKNGVALPRGLGQVGRELYTRVAIAMHQLRQVPFVDERIAAFERRDLQLVVVHADHRVAHLRKTHRRNQPDVP